MRALSARELLEVWERGLAAPPVERALLLLAAACPDTPVEALARESVGGRDARLLRLREETFGLRLSSLADCPACGERLETAFEVTDIRVEVTASQEPLALSAAGCELSFRLPNSLDVAALALRNGASNASGDTGSDPRRRLLDRCLIAARGPQGEALAAAELPDTAVAAIAAKMATADPQGDVELALSCPSCGHGWPAAFDILTYFWTEVDAWARLLLHEIHRLAAAYHWSERDILELSPWRRRAYLELIGA